MISNFLRSVRAWNIVSGTPLSSTPTVGDSYQNNLMVSLLQEEVAEYKAALHYKDVKEIADALGDVITICASAAAQHGIDLAPVIEEIMRSNWTKFKQVSEKPSEVQEFNRLIALRLQNSSISMIRYVEIDNKIFEVVLRDDRKILKHPETYVPPKIENLLEGYPASHLDEFFLKEARKFATDNDLLLSEQPLENLAKKFKDLAGY